MERDAVRQVAVVAAVGGLIGLGATGDYGSADEAGTRLGPADWAFGIWAPIYAGAVGFAVHQARRSRRADPLLRRVGWPAATGYLTAGLWVRVFPAEQLALSLPLLATTITGAALAYGRLGPAPAAEDPATTWLVRVPLALFAGWITLATTVSVGEVLVDAGLPDLGLTVTQWSAGVLLAAGAVATAVTLRTRGSLAYPAALAWGFAGVAVQWGAQARAVGVVGAGLAAVVAAAGAWAARRRPGAPSRAPARAG